MDEFDRQTQALLQQIETMGDEPGVKLIAAALREAGKREIDRLIAQIDALDERVSDLMIAVDQRDDKLAELRAENERLQAEADERIGMATQVTARVQIEIDQLKAQLAEAKQEAEDNYVQVYVK